MFLRRSCRIPLLGLLLFAACATVLLANEAERVWKDDTGKREVTATLQAVGDDSVVLRTGAGKSISVPLSRLSDADREYAAGFPTRKALQGATVVKIDKGVVTFRTAAGVLQEKPKKEIDAADPHYIPIQIEVGNIVDMLKQGDFVLDHGAVLEQVKNVCAMLSDSWVACDDTTFVALLGDARRGRAQGLYECQFKARRFGDLDGPSYYFHPGAGFQQRMVFGAEPPAIVGQPGPPRGQPAASTKRQVTPMPQWDFVGNVCFYAEYADGNKSDRVYMWDEHGVPTYCCDYKRDKPHGYACLFQQGLPDVVASYDTGKLQYVHLISNGAVASSLPGDQVAGNSIAGDRWAAFQAAQKAGRDMETRLKRDRQERETALKHDLASVLGPAKRQRISVTINQRRQENADFIARQKRHSDQQQWYDQRRAIYTQYDPLNHNRLRPEFGGR